MEHDNSIDPDNCFFYVEATNKGYVLKVLFDVLSEFYGRIEMRLSMDKILIVRTDEDAATCHHVTLNRDGFRGFKYGGGKEESIISVDLCLLQKLLKNTKKKETIILYILEDKRNELCFQISPENTSNKINRRSETLRLTIHKVACPSNDNDVILPSLDCYHLPVAIDQGDYQKIKKLLHGGKLHIVMQADVYLQIADIDITYSSDLVFGRKKQGKGELYDRHFDKSTFKKTAKITGLSDTIQFCSPKVEQYPQYPLLIKVNVGNFGQLMMFIKDEKQLDEEKVKVNDIHEY